MSNACSRPARLHPANFLSGIITASILTACVPEGEQRFEPAEPSIGEARAIEEATAMLEHPRPGDTQTTGKDLPQTAGDTKAEGAP